MSKQRLAIATGLAASLIAMFVAVASPVAAADPPIPPAAAQQSSAPPAATPGAGLNLVDASRWPLETVRRLDGGEFSGLIRHEDDQQIELVEVRRPAARPMNLLVRPIKKSDVTQVTRLSATERDVLKQRIDAFRNRTAILAAQIEDVRLVDVPVETTRARKKRWHYVGPWFTLDSTADEPVTREAIVRTEQTFAGYRTLLRPRQEPAHAVSILLFGSILEYQQHLAASGLKIRNQAFFDPQRKLIVAGGELGSMAARLNDARAYHQNLLDKIRKLDKRQRQLAQQLSNDLAKTGATVEQRRQVITASRQQWQKQRDELERDIGRAKQENEALYYRQFSRLYHEAFHAYLDEYVFDKRQYDVPRWLNEGWAQVFEAGQLDGDSLRLDAPRGDLLKTLAMDLRQPARLTLAEVLTAPVNDFVVAHDETPEKATRLYRYSWGLAYYLTFERQLLETPKMEEYLHRDDGALTPIARFERLVGQPLKSFEAQWVRTMLELSDRT